MNYCSEKDQEHDDHPVITSKKGKQNHYLEQEIQIISDSFRHKKTAPVRCGFFRFLNLTLSSKDRQKDQDEGMISRNQYEVNNNSISSPHPDPGGRDFRNRNVSGRARGLAGRNRLTDVDNASPLIKSVHHY